MSHNSFRRSGSQGSMTSKNNTSNPKKVLFDSKTLQGLLGLTPAVGKPLKTKADRKAQRKATQSQTREYSRMVESILLEETGRVVKSKKKKKQQRSTAILKTAFRSVDQTSSVLPPPAARKESVVNYAAALGCQHDDMSFLDCKYDNIKFQTKQIMSKLEHGYETIIQRNDNLLTVDDAIVLLSYAEVDMDSAVFDIGISKSLVDNVDQKWGKGEGKGGGDKSDSLSLPNENDMAIKDISTMELDQNIIADPTTTTTVSSPQPQQQMTTDTTPVDYIYFDVWMVHTAVAVRLRQTQDALAIERGISVATNSVLGNQNQHNSSTMLHGGGGEYSRVVGKSGEGTEELFGFEVLEKELQQGLESAYSQSLANFDFSTIENGNPSGMLRSKSQPDPQSQSRFGDDTERLAPLRLKKLKKQEAMQETKTLGHFDQGFGRETPRCLRPGESQHENTGSLAAIEELRRELMLANEGLMHLDSMVAENIQWVHANCDVQGVLEKKGQTLSNRAIAQCRQMAAERLSDVLESYITVALRGAFGRLKQAVKMSTIANTSKNYVRGKCIEITTNVLSVALRRQYKKMFDPWVLRVRWETRWEQEAATVEIQRVARAYLAKRRVFNIICELKSIIIQCCIRVFLSKCRVLHAKRAREMHIAATTMKYFVRGRVLIKVAKAKVQSRREERAALKIQAAFRGFQGREQVRAIRAHIALQNWSACRIQQMYRAKIQSYYAVLERKRFVKMQRIEAERRAMQIEAMREDAAIKIQSQARRLSAVKRVAIKRQAKKLNDCVLILQRYFKLRVATKIDRNNLIIRRQRHNAAIKIQSICRMRFGQKKMARRRDDHARGIPLQTDPSYDEDDPEVQAAAVKLQSLTRGVQARQKATEKKTDKKKNKLRLKGRQNKSNETEKVDDPPKSASRNFSVRNLLSRGASREVSPPNSRPNSSKELPVVQNKKSARASSPTSPSNSRPNSRQNSASSARKGYKDKDSDRDISPASPSESLRRSYTESNLSRPTSGQKSKPTSRPSSRESSFKGMLSRGLSSLRTKDVKAEEIKADNRKYTEGDEEEEIDEVGDAGKESFSTTANSRNNSSSSSRRKTEQSGGDLKKPIPLQPKTPSRPVEELDNQRVISPQKEEEEENGKNSDTESKSRPTSVRSVKSSSRPSSSSIKKTPTANSSRPTSPVMKSPSSPQSQDIHTVATLSSKSRKVEDEEVDAQSMAEDLEQARKKVGGDMEEAGEKCEVEEEVDNGKENKKDETDDNEAAQEQVEQVEKQEDVDRKAKEKAARSASFKIKRSATPKPPSIDDEGGSRGRPLSREGSKRAVSPGGGLLRQASSKIFGRFNSTDAVDSPDAGSTRSKSPSLLSRSPSLSQSFKSMSSKFSASFRGPVKYKPNATYKPKVRTLIPRNNDEAATRISSIVRQRLGYKKLKAKKKEIRNLQKKAGLIVLWAIVTIQRVIRGRIGRWRWTRLHKEHKALLAKEENDRIWKELEEEEEREKAEKAEKQRLADEQEERNNAMWSQYGKPKPKGEGDGKGKIGDGGDIDPSHRVIPPPTTEPPPLHSTQPLHSSAGVSELDERMRRLEEMEKTMIEKEERMILAAQRAEEKAAEMQRAIEAMEKRAQEDEAEKQVRRSMMELAAGPMSSLGSQLSTGPVRSSRPSARNMVSSRSSGANSSRPPPSARSAKDGTPRPKEVLTVHVHGVEWCQLWDADENAWYWYCESTGVAQWDQPTESGGYESNGALTDYSTENDGWNTESGSQWQEYWDEQAQAKYWYNTSTGEASWTPPEAEVGSAGSFQGPAGDDWVSYIDDATGEEYWYNTKTGETSWSN